MHFATNEKHLLTAGSYPCPSKDLVDRPEIHGIVRS